MSDLSKSMGEKTHFNADEARPPPLTFGVLLSRARRWWALGIALVVLGAALGLSVSQLLTPIYRAETVLQPAQPIGNGDNFLLGGASLAPLIGEAATPALVSEALALTRSRRFVREFVEELEIAPTLFPGRWNEERQQWKEPGALARLAASLNRSGPAEAEPSNEEIYRRFMEMMTAEVRPNDSMVILSVTAEDPKDAAEWANALVEKANEEVRRRALNEANGNLRFLNDGLRSVTMPFARESLAQLAQDEYRKQMLAAAQPNYAFVPVDPASVPDEPVSPKPLLMAIFGAMLGLVGFVGFLAFRHS